MSRLDHAVVSQRYFFPRRAPLKDPFVVPVKDAELHCWFRRAPEGAPTLVHFHGNGEVVADYLPDFAERFTREGWGVLLSEYRGYGGSTGSPKMVSMLDDALAVFDAGSLDPSRTVVYGRSVGSIYGLHLAANRPVKALVLESGIASPLERILLRATPAELGCTMEQLQTDAGTHVDHARKLAAYGGEVVVLHTVWDHMVDFHHAERLARWSHGQLIPLTPGDHNSILAHHLDRIVARVLELG